MEMCILAFFGNEVKTQYSAFLRFILLLVICSFQEVHCTVNDIARWEKQAAGVTIIRDHCGIPHIYAKTDALVVFGMIYAQCEDDFNRVETNYISSMGRRAETEGEALLFNDLRMKFFIDPEIIKKEYENSPPWLRKLMDAFADGINYYLYKHPEVRPRLLTCFEPWMALSFTEGSIGTDIEEIPVSLLGKFYGDKLFSEECEDALQRSISDQGGSNGFAIAPVNTVSGNALLLINPHTSLFFRSEVDMNSSQGLHAYGAVTWGQFFIYQGFNENCGWMHTSSGADAIDFYQETVLEKDGKYYYVYGSEQRPFVEKKIKLGYIENGALLEKEILVYYSHHGPVIGEQDGKWLTVRLMVEHKKALIQSFMRTKSTGFADFNRIMALRTNSSNNTMYADREGNIAYYHGNFMPVRDQEFDWLKPVDGSTPDTEWKGLHAPDEMIRIKNPSNGWIQNCNSTPFSACGKYSPAKEDYPIYMAPDSENPRGLHAIRVLQNKTDFTLDKLLAAAYDTYLTAFEDMIRPLVKAYDHVSLSDESMKKTLSEPIEMLRNWDLRYALNSVPTSLAVYYGHELNRPGAMAEISAENNADREKMQLAVLASVIKQLEANFGTWKMPWGDVNRYQRLSGDIVQQFNDEQPSLPVPFVSSRWGSLAAFESRTYPGTKKMYGTSGNSFVAAVEFGKKIKAKSILAGGISNVPGTPHFDDQALMYTEGSFKDVLFYREDVEKSAIRTYHPGE